MNTETCPRCYGIKFTITRAVDHTNKFPIKKEYVTVCDFCWGRDSVDWLSKATYRPMSILPFDVSDKDRKAIFYDEYNGNVSHILDVPTLDELKQSYKNIEKEPPIHNINIY